LNKYRKEIVKYINGEEILRSAGSVKTGEGETGKKTKNVRDLWQDGGW